jgi:hypothetical protein
MQQGAEFGSLAVGDYVSDYTQDDHEAHVAMAATTVRSMSTTNIIKLGQRKNHPVEEEEDEPQQGTRKRAEEMDSMRTALGLPWWPATPTTNSTTQKANEDPVNLSVQERMQMWHDNRIQREQSVEEAFHSTRLLGQEALLLDIGAYDNLTGDRWVRRQEEHAARFGGVTIRQPLKQTLGIEGVGKGAQEAKEAATCPIALENGELSTYTAPEVQNSNIPALLGLRAVEAQNGVIDTRRGQQKMYLGDVDCVQIIPKKNTRVVNLVPAPSGHLMIPVSNFQQVVSKAVWTFPATSQQLGLPEEEQPEQK